MMHPSHNLKHFPFKSAAVALLFSVILGPIGLLYASLWGGFFLIMVSTIILTNKLFKLLILVWIACCVWSVGAVESYNNKHLKNFRIEGQ